MNIWTFLKVFLISVFLFLFVSIALIAAEYFNDFHLPFCGNAHETIVKLDETAEMASHAEQCDVFKMSNMDTSICIINA